MASFAIGGRVGGGVGIGGRKDRRAISCIYEDDEGPHSLDRFLRPGGGHAFARKNYPIVRSENWHLNDDSPFLSLQLHSEYRSTYKWHEFTPKQTSSGGQQEVVRNPPLSSNSKILNFFHIIFLNVAIFNKIL
jgi:hypothetical protein